MSRVRQVLETTGLFNTLNTSEMSGLLKRVTKRKFDAGEMIVREGTAGDHLYVLLTGAAQVFTRGPDGREVVLARLEPGQYFGEQALLPKATGLRSASVRAQTPVHVLSVTHEDFQGALAQDSPLKEHLIRLNNKRTRAAVQRQFALFRTLDFQDEELWKSTVEFPDQQIVFRQDDPGDAFYLILSGRAAVYRSSDGGQQLIVTLGAGQCFGELALLEGTTRAATVVADGALKVLVLDKDRFTRLHQSSPELREYLQTLSRVYRLPNRGFVSQHSGRFMGLETVTTVYHLLDGATATASHPVGTDYYSLMRSSSDEAEPRAVTWSNTETGARREIYLSHDRLVGVLALGTWNDLGNIHTMVLDHATVAPWQVSVFRETGELRLEQPASFPEDEETVCACLDVTRGTLRETLRHGCGSADDLSAATGAGSVCGACRVKLEEMVGNAAWTAVDVTRCTEVCPGIHTYRFSPVEGSLKPALPGQYIVVAAEIDGNWVERPYTLTSAGGETDYHEITVKREERGLLSRWLSAQRGNEAWVRISDPHGSFCADLSRAGPIVCLVGGIGMTPALSICRSVVKEASGQNLYVDYSASTATLFAYADELAQAEAEHENVQIYLRTTGKTGHLTQRDVDAIVRDYPRAAFYVCGPQGYNHAVTRMLRAAGVPTGQVNLEEFTPVGVPPVRAQEKADHSDDVCPIDHRQLVSDAYADFPYSTPVDANSSTGVADEARAFLSQLYHEKGVPAAFKKRWQEVRSQIEATGTYTHTYDEVSYGAKLAWRNSSRCIGRLFWNGLQVRDMRHLKTEEEMFQALVEHIRLATNEGNLRAVMTVFAAQQPGQPGPRIWNSQLCRYAGYRSTDGRVVGDPNSVALTDRLLEMGWKGGDRTPFDLLPIAIQLPGRKPGFFELPQQAVLEVPIVHPALAWFEELGLKWYALPAVSELLFDCGGVKYTMAPFNGWYMGTEIGARNFSDVTRYDMLPEIAKRMGLDTSRERTLWRDRALIELNIAVLYSYEQRGVKMGDHHELAESFLEFNSAEQVAGRPVFANWSWIVPPISGSTTPVFFHKWNDVLLKPNYFSQATPWSET